MTEDMALKVFRTFMILTAGTLLINIWAGTFYPDSLAPWLFRVPPTFFIIGFASFLLWAPLIAYRFLHKNPRSPT